MQAKYLNGIEYKWNVGGHIAGKDNRPRSQHHIRTRGLLLNLFPTIQVLEETPIKIYHYKTLWLDFYIPLLQVAIEVHGEQHYKFNQFFHKTQAKFIQARKNDRLKKEWCELNEIHFVELPHYETTDEWEKKIRCLTSKNE